MEPALTTYSHLYKHHTYTTRHELLTVEERVTLAYKRAEAVILAWDLSAEDIKTCSGKFWDLQKDPILILDVGCYTILACHINLFLGALTPLLQTRPDLTPIVEKGLKCEFFGNWLLTEVGHGIDIGSIETTATKVEDGFILNTPNPNAAKFMPPTTPSTAYDKMAIVFARLIVDGNARGVHPFLVTTSTRRGMCKGVHAKQMPPRLGSPLDFSITFFNNLHLPPSSFLGKSLDTPEDEKKLLHSYIWRITVGTLTVPVTSSLALRVIATIGSDYSYRRHVAGPDGSLRPIMQFRTQQLPILYSTAAAYVFHAWVPLIIQQFMDLSTDQRVRHGIAVVFKATVLRTVKMLCPAVSERLGAQGVFGHNMIGQLEADIRGGSIAEGEVLAVCIRLFSELLLNRYTLKQPSHLQTSLARHASSVISESRSLLSQMKDGHRGELYSNIILPRSELAITSLGYALAFSCAMDGGVPEPLLKMFECYVVQQDPVWYYEHMGITREKLQSLEDEAVRSALPMLKAYIDNLDSRRWITAPILSDESWRTWLFSLRGYSGEEKQDEALFVDTERLTRPRL